MEKEIAVMNKVFNLIKDLDRNAQIRIAKWLFFRFYDKKKIKRWTRRKEPFGKTRSKTGEKYIYKRIGKKGFSVERWEYGWGENIHFWAFCDTMEEALVIRDVMYDLTLEELLVTYKNSYKG